MRVAGARWTVAVVACSFVLLACAPRGADEATPIDTPGTSATPAPTLDLTPSPTATHTPSPSPSASATTAPTETPSPTPAPAVTYLVDNEVPEREGALIEFGIRLAEAHAEERFGGAVKRPTIVRVAGEGVCIGGATAIGYRICINASSESWLALEPEYLKLKIAAHEYFHVWQHDRFCYREPKWLFEGAAEWFGYEVIVGEGLVEEVVASVAQQQILQAEPVLEPLAEQEVLYAAPQPRQYALWYFAARYLLDRPGGSRIDALQAFCAGREEGLPWREAFEEAFGLIPAQFYEAFEAFRDEFLPYSSPG